MALAGLPQLSGEVEAYRANIWKIYVFRFFLNFQFWWPIWVIYLTDLRGLSFTQVAILEAPFFLSMVLIQVPAGIFADRHGRKLTICIGTFLSALSIVAFGTADSYLLILGTYVIWAWSLAIMQSADSAFMYDSLKMIGEEGRFPEVMGRSQAIFNIAILASMLVGAPLAASVGLDRAVQLSAISSLAALGMALTLREPTLRVEGVRPGVRDFVRESYAIGKRDRRIPLLMILYGFLGVGSIATAVFFQPFLDGHGVDVANVGYLQAPARVFGALGALSAFWLARRAGEMRSLYLIAGSATAAYAVLGVWDSIGAFIMFPVISMVSAAAIPLITNMLNQRIPSERRATVLSAGQLTLALVMAGFSPLLGSIADAYSLTVGFLAGGVVIGTGSLLALVALGAGSQLPREPATEGAVAAGGD
ncbi:MAG TPA: MFS transporter [Dehalococcoidia bacterium]|nr:MFS transporter [Dehalococcoidia bacterium]